MKCAIKRLGQVIHEGEMRYTYNLREIEHFSESR
jgi:hypothetical protein